MSAPASPAAPVAPAPATSAILFDFGGTLDSDGVAWKERFRRIWREEAGEVPAERFDPAFYAADDALVGSVAADLPLTEAVERLARSIARRLGEADGALAARAAARFSRETLEMLSGRGPLLARLARRYRLGIVSNFYGNLAAACAEAGIDRNFAAMIDSADVGATKPDARIFQAALDKLRVRAEETVFVGDSVARDMAGARSLGMRHVLLKPLASGEGAESAGDGLFLCCPEDRVIHRLEDLEEVLA